MSMHASRENDYLYSRSQHSADVQVAGQFETQTDALLARFVLEKSEVPIRVVDELIYLLKDPSFVPAELSFSSVEDVFLQVAQRRRNFPLGRPMSDGATCGCTQIRVKSAGHARTPRIDLPDDVLDLVASHLFNERRSFGELARAQEASLATQGRFVLTTPCPRIRDLMNMSLVARTWYRPALRFLQRSMKVVGPAGLRSALSNPRVGRSLRELHVVLPSGIPSSGKQSSDIHETLFLLCALLRRVPSLVALYLQMSFAALEDPADRAVSIGLGEVLTLLAGMQSIRYLWLTHIPGPILYSGDVDAACQHLHSLYCILPRMRALECLWVHNWSEGGMYDTGIVVPIIKGTSLRSLSFKQGGGATYSLGPRIHGSGSFSPLIELARPIKRLHVFASNLFTGNPVAASALFTGLTSLSEGLTRLYLTVDCAPENLDASALSTRLFVPATQLSDLAIILTGSTTRLPRLTLPANLRNLHVHVARSAMRTSVLYTQRTLHTSEKAWTKLDEDLSSMLLRRLAQDSSPTAKASLLQKVILTLEPTSSMRNEAERGILDESRWRIEGLPIVPETIRVCVERKITIEYYRSEAPMFDS